MKVSDYTRDHFEPLNESEHVPDVLQINVLTHLITLFINIGITLSFLFVCANVTQDTHEKIDIS